MTTYQYLIVGGGMAADSAARGIRDIDKKGSIAILSADVDAPYPRPALSKKLWTDPEFTWDQADLATVADTGAELRLGTEVLSIDRDGKTVLTASGQVFGYQKLLLVTGLTPSRIDDDGDAVLYFRSARDYQKLRALAQPGHQFVVVGGGYIGAELAAGLVQQGCEVALVTPDPTLDGSQFPAQIASEYQKLFADAGVHLVTGKRVCSVRKHEAAEVTLDDGTILQADDVIAGLGHPRSPNWPRKQALPLMMGSSLMSSCAPTIRPSGPPETSPITRTRCWAAPASSICTMSSRWARRPAASWRDQKTPTPIPR